MPNPTPITPQHDLAMANEARQSAAQDFLDWLYDEKRMVLCQWRDEQYISDDGRIGQHVVCEDGIERLLFPRTDGREVGWQIPSTGEYGEMLPHDNRWFNPEGYYPMVQGDSEKGRLLAEYIGVDYDAYQQEKEAMYQYLVAMNSAKE
jgi:hypothetical protein